MTNQEADQIIARTKRRALLHFVLTSQVNGTAFIALAALGLVAISTSAFLVALLVFTLLACIVGGSFCIQLQRYRRNHEMAFWNMIGKQGLSGEPPTGNTRLLIDKIVEIRAATPADELLPTRQAVKLVAAYQRQSRQLEAINARLAKIDSTRQTLTEKIDQLRALGENHSAGLNNLEQTRANSDALQKVEHEIQSSCDRLDAILDGVRKTARTRQLHRELDQLSAPDAAPDQTIEPALESESLEEIERQIGREIETYLRLERETEEQLR